MHIEEAQNKIDKQTETIDHLVNILLRVRTICREGKDPITNCKLVKDQVDGTLQELGIN